MFLSLLAPLGSRLDASDLFFQYWFYLSCVEQVGRQLLGILRSVESCFEKNPVLGNSSKNRIKSRSLERLRVG